MCGFCFVFNIISPSLSSFNKSIGIKDNNNNKRESGMIDNINGFVLRRGSNSSSNDLFDSYEQSDVSKMFQDYQKRVLHMADVHLLAMEFMI